MDWSLTRGEPAAKYKVAFSVRSATRHRRHTPPAPVVPNPAAGARSDHNATEQARGQSGSEVVTVGSVYLPKGWEWDRAIPASDRELIAERILQLPAWADGQLEAANLDAKPLQGRAGLSRLRVGDYRAVFQHYCADVVILRVARRSEVYEGLERLTLVRTRDGLRPLRTDPPPPPPEPSPLRAARPIVRAAVREVVRNPLTTFTDAELATLDGIGAEAIAALRRLPADLLPDETLASHGVPVDVARLLAEVWDDPSAYTGHALDVQAAHLNAQEVIARLAADYSATSLVAVHDASAFLSLLDAGIEEWMVYLHPSQLAAVRQPPLGPSRVGGGAGTGKTVVALHRARYLAEQTGGPVLLTTYVKHLPKVWEGLFHTFAPDVAGRIVMTNVDSIAYDLCREAGGVWEVAQQDERSAIVHDVWKPRVHRLGGLNELALQDEFDHVIVGRDLPDLDAYLALDRVGRGSGLPARARTVAWEAYEEYARQMKRRRLTYFPELRRDAVRALRDGRVTRRYEAVVTDEAQDLDESAIRLLTVLAGGLPEPNLTLVGDGQQQIYPGGFSLFSIGVDVRRGRRATVLRANWRNTYRIWTAAQAFAADDPFADLNSDETTPRLPADAPVPMRDGATPRLWNAGDGGYDAEAELAAAIIEDAVSVGADPGDCAVLAPSNDQAKQALRALTQAGVAAEALSKYAGEHQGVVWVGTFHRAKGLEFKHVVVTGLSAATWPAKRQGLDDEALEEARHRATRAAFVALTRARDRLDVVYSGDPATELARARPWFEE